MPNSIYRVEIMFLTQADTAPDFSFRVARNGLSNADLRYTGDLDNPAGSSFTFNGQQNIIGAGSTTNPRIGNYIGMLSTGSDTGEVSIQWRQQTSNAGITRLKLGSMLMLRRVV